MAEHKVLIMGVDEERSRSTTNAPKWPTWMSNSSKPTQQSEGEAIELVRDADALMMRSTPYQGEQVIRAAEKAQVLAVYSHGFNQIDTDVCNEMGIIITNGAGMCMEEVSNQAVTNDPVPQPAAHSVQRTDESRTMGARRRPPVDRAHRPAGPRTSRPRQHRSPSGAKDVQWLAHEGHRIRPLLSALDRPGIRRRAGLFASRALRAFRLCLRADPAQQRDAPHDAQRALRLHEADSILRQCVPRRSRPRSRSHSKPSEKASCAAPASTSSNRSQSIPTTRS